MFGCRRISEILPVSIMHELYGYEAGGGGGGICPLHSFFAEYVHQFLELIHDSTTDTRQYTHFESGHKVFIFPRTVRPLYRATARLS